MAKFFRYMQYTFEVTVKDHRVERQEDRNVRFYQLLERSFDHVR